MHNTISAIIEKKCMNILNLYMCNAKRKLLEYKTIEFSNTSYILYFSTYWSPSQTIMHRDFKCLLSRYLKRLLSRSATHVP